ncbi:MAG: cupin domain-containing protein, partial [Candidatus Methanofastidiosa archaeon]|nr:cupin domain-containing protein [Candidatus Methanofastidiosa archaeon]
PLIVRAHDRQPELVTHKGTDRPPSHLFHSLGRGKVDRHMEPFFIEILPEHDEERRLSSHEGEEFIVVVCGTIEVIYGTETHILEAGDSIYYNSVVPHYVSSANGEGASIYAVLYLPE